VLPVPAGTAPVEPELAFEESPVEALVVVIEPDAREALEQRGVVG
jgi:hypothetical protein